MPESIPSPHKPLVIAFDAKRLFNNFTGLGNYSRTLVRNLHKYFPENEYHLFTPSITENVETSWFLEEKSFHIHLPASRNPMWRSFGMSSQVNALNPDIFHGLSHELPFGLANNITKIVTFHDLIYERFPDQFGMWDRFMYKLKYKSAAKRADAIAAISESTKLDLCEFYGIDKDKIDLVFQSCGDHFQSDNDTGNNKISAPEVKDFYLYVGSVIERKGLLQCVLAYAKLPEKYRKPFVVIGNGDKDYMRKVKEMIQYYRLESNFLFVNGVTNAELVAYYDHCFCLVYPSIFEGFGIPIIESLFRHKPVITSDISSLPEAAGPGAILVNPYSPDDIATAMVRLHETHGYESLATNGYDYVHDHFSSQKTAENLMQMYHKSIERYRP